MTTARTGTWAGRLTRLGFTDALRAERMLGDAADSPITSIRGSANQWRGAVGIGYTF